MQRNVSVLSDNERVQVNAALYNALWDTSFEITYHGYNGVKVATYYDVITALQIMDVPMMCIAPEVFGDWK